MKEQQEKKQKLNTLADEGGWESMIKQQHEEQYLALQKNLNLIVNNHDEEMAYNDNDINSEKLSKDNELNSKGKDDSVGTIDNSTINTKETNEYFKNSIEGQLYTMQVSIKLTK